MPHLIDVCIPVFNEDKCIGNLLEALTRQSFQDFKVSIYDNASTDLSLSIVRDFSNRLNIQIFSNSTNIGQTANINRSFRNCTSEYVALLSGNDLIESNYLEALLVELMSNSDAGCAYAKAVVADKNSRAVNPQPRWYKFFSILNDEPIDRACKSILQYCQASNFFALYRRTILDRVQPQPYRYGGDHVFTAEVALYGKVLYTDKTIMYRNSSQETGKSETRREHLLRVFSKDDERGLGENSKLSSFDLITPNIDMFHGFLGMFRHADISLEDRSKLISRGIQSVAKRTGNGVKLEAGRIVSLFDRIIRDFKLESFVDRITLFHMQKKVDECMLIYRNEKLIELKRTLNTLYTEDIVSSWEIPRVSSHRNL